MPREIQINVPTYNKIKAAPAPPRLPNSETSTKCSEINLAVTEADQKHSADRRNAYFSFVSPTNNADRDKSYSPSPKTSCITSWQQQSTSLAISTVTTVSAALTTTTTTTNSAMTAVSQRSSPTHAQTAISAPVQAQQRSSAQVDLLNPTTRTLTQTSIDSLAISTVTTVSAALTTTTTTTNSAMTAVSQRSSPTHAQTAISAPVQAQQRSSAQVDLLNPTTRTLTQTSIDRITVEEPHKRNGPVQSTNCQEFGHTRTYCTLCPVCVACGDRHTSASCKAIKADEAVKKCSNCGGNHTANYRGCPVYKDLKSRMNQRNTAVRS
ncbi:PREDICTED: mucin-21-like [Rhagoletis zephyria]|uniref:mucin-21-like n=1 Tax=Rhagoletis zephyria TaxID=28612 RepID=UPI00081166C2|nr:PREDICTED: mucin-21-like [Rhagoletis zephyria]